MTNLAKACAALVFLQAGALEAQTPAPSENRPRVDALMDGILKAQDGKPASPSAGAGSQSVPPPPAGRVAPPALAEAVRAKIRPCWLSLGIKSPPVVAVRVEMNRDATPARAEVRDRQRYLADDSFRQAADGAVRAVMNPRCQPWPLPPENYDSWRVITFNFDPRDS